MTPPPFDPLAILAALEQHRVAFVVVGRLAAVIHGAGGIANEVEICPQMKDANLLRLAKAIEALGGRPGDALAAAVGAAEEVAAIRLDTPAGRVVVNPRPAGTRGWDDLRRRAAREPLGQGVRAAVASPDDLVRVAGSIDRPEERVSLDTLRRVAELERPRGASR